VVTSYFSSSLGLAAVHFLQEDMAHGSHLHNSGQAVVWSGPREPAELYWEQLKGAGLTMAPLERG